MIHRGVQVSTEIVCTGLDDRELTALYRWAHSDADATGEEPGFDRWRILLTERDRTRVHRDTLRVIDAIVLERLGPIGKRADE